MYRKHKKGIFFFSNLGQFFFCVFFKVLSKKIGKFVGIEFPSSLLAPIDGKLTHCCYSDKMN